MTDKNSRSVLELFNLSGRVAIVTGGAGLLGQQMSEALTEAGAGVVIASRTPENCETWAAELRSREANAIAVQVDVSRPDEVQNMIAVTLDHFGRLDILVNNAMGRGIPAQPEDLTPESWRIWIDIGLSGAF